MLHHLTRQIGHSYDGYFPRQSILRRIASGSDHKGIIFERIIGTYEPSRRVFGVVLRSKHEGVDD